MTALGDTVDMVDALFELGFSQYEAKCYVGLMAREPQTGYGVSKATGVPQPKVYEALRKLAARGAVYELAGDPTRFHAVPPEALFDDLKGSFERRLDQARESARAIASENIPAEIEYTERFGTHEAVLATAKECIDAASHRIYLSASAQELASLTEAVEAALGRGVDVVVLAFGAQLSGMEGARIFEHASTNGALFRHHQARHVALVADSRECLNAIAADGHHWQGIRTASEPVIAAVKGFIRHDIDLQQIFSDFGPQLIEAYGPGLQKLESYRRKPAGQAAEVQTNGQQEELTQRVG